LGKFVQKLFGFANVGAFGGQFSCPSDTVGGVNRILHELEEEEEEKELATQLN
jgi:hypothetical protein